MQQKLFTKNFTLLVLGQVSSLFGNFILKLALSMYVLEITGSATIFAGILAIATIPTILFSPFGGILADRVNRRNIMVALDLLTGISVLSATIFLSGNGNLTVIGVLLVALSVLGAFESPTVQACVPQMLSGDNILKGNAVVNQVAAVAALVAPILGSLLYASFGLKPVMYGSILCFFLTAFIECFIQLDAVDHNNTEAIFTSGKNEYGIFIRFKEGTLDKIFTTVKEDFKVSMHFISREQPGVLKLLLLAALVSFFVIGIALVGLPFIVRTILGLNVAFYGAAESVLGFAAILGSIAAGLLIGKLKINSLWLLIIVLGASLIPAGIVFLLPLSNVAKYAVVLFSFAIMQVAACIFSVFALTLIQQRTPVHLMGKVMAYVATISICAQPLGQTIYGVLFDSLKGKVYIILFPTAIIIIFIGLSAVKFFAKLSLSENKISQS